MKLLSMKQAYRIPFGRHSYSKGSDNVELLPIYITLFKIFAYNFLCQSVYSSNSLLRYTKGFLKGFQENQHCWIITKHANQVARVKLWNFLVDKIFPEFVHKKQTQERVPLRELQFACLFTVGSYQVSLKIVHIVQSKVHCGVVH